MHPMNECGQCSSTEPACDETCPSCTLPNGTHRPQSLNRASHVSEEHYRALKKALDWYGYHNTSRSLGVMLLGLSVGFFAMDYTFHDPLLYDLGVGAGLVFLITAGVAIYFLKRAKHFGRLAHPIDTTVKHNL